MTLPTFPRLRHCLHCGKPFTALHLRSIYCSVACLVEREREFRECHEGRKLGKGVKA